jgi:hypothetical protein
VGGPNVDIFREYGKSTIDLIVPFEAVGSLDGGLEFNHRCGKVFVSLRELAFSANQFYLRKDKAGRKKPFKRRHAGLLQIVDVKPLVQHITSWNLALEFEQLDWKSATSVIPNPFLQILAPLPQGSLSPYELLYLSEAAQQTTDVALAPFAINVARAGGMDSDLLVRALSRDGAAASLIGEYTMTLRSMVFGRYGFLVHPIKRNTYDTCHPYLLVLILTYRHSLGSLITRALGGYESRKQTPTLTLYMPHTAWSFFSPCRNL